MFQFFYGNFSRPSKTGKAIYMVTNQLEDDCVFCYNTLVQVISHEIDVNKWEIVCEILEVSRNM